MNKKFYDKANWYIKQIESIQNIINKAQLDQEKMQRAHDIMKELKGKLTEDSKLAQHTKTRIQNMTEFEAQFYSTVLEVRSKIKVRPDSDPHTHDWSGVLHEAKDEFENYMRDLVERRL